MLLTRVRSEIGGARRLSVRGVAKRQTTRIIDLLGVLPTKAVIYTDRYDTAVVWWLGDAPSTFDSSGSSTPSNGEQSTKMQ